MWGRSKKDRIAELGKALIADWSRELRRVAKDPSCPQIRAVAIYWVPDNCATYLGWDTSEDAARRFEAEEASGRTPRCRGVHRLSPPEFSCFAPDCQRASTERKWGKLSALMYEGPEAEAEQCRLEFVEMLVAAIRQLRPIFEELNRSPDFVSFVWPHDSGDEGITYLLRQTIGEDLLARVAPESL